MTSLYKQFTQGLAAFMLVGASVLHAQAPATSVRSRVMEVTLSQSSSVSAAGGITPALTAEHVDWQQCHAFAGAKDLGPAPRATLESLLGLQLATEGAPEEWSTGPSSEEMRYFRLAFLEPGVEAGTLIMGPNVGRVSELKPDAPYPGDVNVEQHWADLPTGRVITWPAGHRIRALRILDQNSPVAWAPNSRASTLGPLIVLRERFADMLRLGNSEYREREGGQEWVGYWAQPLRVCALAVLGASLPETVRLLAGDFERHPLQAGPELWRAGQVEPVAADPRVGWIRADAEANLALAFDAAGSARAGAGIYPLVELAADEAVPMLMPPAPVGIAYEMPMDGFAAVNITDAQGNHVRRLVAEVPRAAGPVREDWDLRDDFGRTLPLGTYRWKLLARPPLKLTYEGTVYNAGDPPWQAPVPGGGWWMADHSPPTAVACVGDRMVLASGGAEFGTPLIITDLEGRKVWHTREEHAGTMRLTSDGRAAYAVDDGEVYRIVPGPPVRRERIHRFQYNDDLPGHPQGWIAGDYSGTAARPGLLCVSYQAPAPPWIVSSIRSGDMDPDRNFPPIVRQKVHDTALTKDEEITSAFQLGISSRAGYFGDAVARGPGACTLVLPLRRDVPLGSVVLPPGDIRVYALRPGKALPPEFNLRGAGSPSHSLGGVVEVDGLGDLDMELDDLSPRFADDTWVPLSRKEDQGRAGVVNPPKGMTTRTLLFTGPNLTRIPYAMALDRRYRDVAPEARLVALEGEATPGGGWRTTRTGKEPISLGAPAVAALVWDRPTKMRGYLLTGPMSWAGLAVDVWEGPDAAVIGADAVASDEFWRRVQVHHQTRNHVKYNWHTPMVLRGDLGAVRDVRALRVRVIEHPRSPTALYNAVEGGFEGFVAFQPIGGDIDLPVALAERITVLDLPAVDEKKAEARVRTHLAIEKPGALAFTPGGDLLAACAHGIVRIRDVADQSGVATFDVVIQPGAYRNARALAVDGDNQLYVLDGVQRQVLVFDLDSGQERRRIGKPGGQLGPFDPESLTEPSAMALDTAGKLWIVEQHFQPKRISRWSREGRFEKDFMGPTHYGGGGVMDPRDRSVINHLGMKFRMNWTDRTWTLESRLAPYDANYYAPDRVVYSHGHRYLTGATGRWLSFGGGGPIMALCEEVDGVAVPVMQAGLLGSWDAFVKDREMQETFRDFNAGSTLFVWSDFNRDRQPQLEEVQPIRGLEYRGGIHVGDDLSLNFEGFRLRVTRVEPNGVPRYDVTKQERIPGLSGEMMVDAAGRTFVMGHTLLDTDGTPLWHYPDNYTSVQRSNKVPWGFYNRPAGVLCGSISLLGSFEVGGEMLYGVGSNNGDYYVFTVDGFLAASVLGGPSGYGRRFFSMADCRPGVTDLSDLRKTVEDFHGHITRAEDGNVYAIAGKNHITVIRVDGLEGMRRREGEMQVSTADVEKTRGWLAERVTIERRRQRPRVAQVAFMRNPPQVDGDIYTDWPVSEPITIHEARDDAGRITEQFVARLAFDERHLYVAARSTDASPLVNSARNPALLFTHGDAFDLHLGLNPNADAARPDAVPGDVRLLFSNFSGSPAAVLIRYQPSPGPTAGGPYVYESPMGRLAVADAGVLSGAKVAILRDTQGWVIEAAIPWMSLGWSPPKESFQLRGDLGILESDPDGMNTVSRYYWANRSSVVLGDLPAEARVNPSFWGEFIFEVPDLDDMMEDLLDDDAEPDDLLLMDR